MSLSLTQFFLTTFLLFAISRVFLRFKGGDLSLFGFLFWTGLFGSAIIIVIFPDISTLLAKFLRIGRGTDAVVYVSIILLFYLVFRLYIYLENIRHDITELIKKLALKEVKKNDKRAAKD